MHDDDMEGFVKLGFGEKGEVGVAMSVDGGFLEYSRREEEETKNTFGAGKVLNLNF